jgi:hypothetical protein
MEEYVDGPTGRSYNPYGQRTAQSQRGRIRTALALGALIAAVVVGGLYMTIMQPYAVTHQGDCVFEIQPTGWNGEEVLPCGTSLTRFSIGEEVYLVER